MDFFVHHKSRNVLWNMFLNKQVVRQIFDPVVLVVTLFDEFYDGQTPIKIKRVRKRS